MWCTGWEEKADDYLPSALGLAGRYPHLSFDRADGPGQSVRGHWKLGAIDAYAGARALAWIDDAHDASCEEWARERALAGAPTLLVPTDPAVGLTALHVTALTGWANRLSADGALG